MLKQQILIVDDEEINRVILRGLFEEEYEILEAENGQVATVQIENNSNIALILLDVVMPVMDGFWVLEYMKTNNLLQKIDYRRDDS